MFRDMVADSRSYRSFDESKRITKEELTELIETARLVPSAVNHQPLKYRFVYEKNECEEFLSLTKWAGLLKDIKLPPDNHHPAAFIVMCLDTDVCAMSELVSFDAGIAAQTIMLQACELGYGGCIIGAFDKEKAAEMLRLSKKSTPIVALALGVPDETVFICNTNNSSTAYFRDSAGVHFVPKRSADELIID